MTTSAYAKVDTRDGGFEYGMDAVTPVTWQFGFARKLPKARYVWWIGDDPAIKEFVREHKNKNWIGSKNELVKMLLNLKDQSMQKNPRPKRFRAMSRTAEGKRRKYMTQLRLRAGRSKMRKTIYRVNPSAKPDKYGYNLHEVAAAKGWRLLSQGPYNPGGHGLAPFRIVLSDTGNPPQQYVTHNVNLQTGGFGNGHYFASYEDALEDFKLRSMKRNPRARRDPRKMKRAMRRAGYRVNPRDGSDTMYVEPSWKGFTGFTYSDGKRVTVAHFQSYAEAVTWGSENGFHVVKVDASRRNPRARMYAMTEKPARRATYIVGVKKRGGDIHYFPNRFASLARARSVAQKSANAAGSVYVVKKVAA